MGSFFAELKRRHIYRVAAAYAVVSWLLVQMVNNIAPMLKLPDWIGPAVIVLLAVGFPIALIFAWINELKTPESATAQRASAGPLDWTLIAALVVVLVAVSYQQLTSSRATVTANLPSGVDAARAAAATPASGLSIAVLPFENLSGDASQEFFSDGMTQEIVAALAKIPDLRVVARGSASQFKGERKDMRAIGRALGATHLIEGSVRKAGDRVRITAQLVKADDGVNVWVNNYDRKMTDVFVIQEDIATAIAGALRMPLGLKPGEQLVSNRAIDAASYEQFLRGKAVLFKGRNYFAEQIAILEPVVAHNPNYAPGWAALAYAYGFAVSSYTISASQNASPAELLRLRDGYLPKRNAATHRAIELDPDSVDGLLLLGRSQTGPRKYALAEDFLAKALALDPNNPVALETYSSSLLGLARVKEAVAIKQQLHELEPYIPILAGNLAQALWLDGQTDAAIAILKDNLARVGAGATQDLARVYTSLGRYAEAADVLTQFPNNAIRDLVPIAVPLLRSAPAKVAAPETLPRLGRLGFVYLYVGAPERALDYYEEARPGLTEIAYLWHPTYASLHKTERFKKIVREEGLVDYWRERGWPKFCHPTTGDDFECD